MYINLNKVRKITIDTNDKKDLYYIRFHLDSQQTPETKVVDTEVDVTDFLTTLPENFVVI